MIDGIGQVDLLALFESRGIQLRKAAPNEHHGACPKCQGTDRFGVRHHDGRWWAFCRQCHPQRMDAINVVEWLDGVTKAEAIRQLGLSSSPAKVGNKFPIVKRASPPAAQAQRQAPPPAQWQALMHTWIRRWHDRLFAYDTMSFKALQWLNERGIDGDAIHEFNIGLCDTSSHLNEGKTVWANRGIMIPHSFDGHLWRVRIRRFTSDINADKAKNPNHKPDKYRVVSGAGEDKTVLFGDGDALLADYKSDNPVIRRVIICEGEFDCMLLRSAMKDSTTAVVTTGSASITPKAGWLRLISWTTRDVIIATDADGAGFSAAQKWKSAIPDARIVHPPAKDITDSWTAASAEHPERDAWLRMWVNSL